jgi:hypothetical protein
MKNMILAVIAVCCFCGVAMAYYDDQSTPPTQAEDPEYAGKEFSSINKQIATKMQLFNLAHKKLVRDENKYGSKSPEYLASHTAFVQAQSEYVTLLKLRAFQKSDKKKVKPRKKKMTPTDRSN